MSNLSNHLYELRRRLDELTPLDFVPTIVGLDVTEVPPEQTAVFMLEFRETEAAHCVMRKQAAYDAMDDAAEFARKHRPEWADTVPMSDEVVA